MHVNIWDYKSGDKKLAAVVNVVDGAVQIDGDLAPVLQELLRDIWTHEGGDGAERQYLKNLPLTFSSTYVRAQFVP